MADIAKDTSKRYHHIKDSIIKHILGNCIQPGEKIPSETELVEKLGVCRSTVRRALTQLTDERILVREHGRGTYVSPNMFIRGDKVFGKTGKVGIIIRDSSYINYPYFGTLLHGIISILSSSDYHPMIATIQSDNDTGISNYHSLIDNRSIDGIIIIDQIITVKEIKSINNTGIPLVLIDRKIPGIDIPCVSENHYDGFYKAGKYLIELGHREIGCVLGDLNVEIDKIRIKGFQKALDKHGIKFNPDNIIEVMNFPALSPEHTPAETVDKIVSRLKECTQKTKLPGAMIISSDFIGLGFARYLYESNNKTPEDISYIIVGSTLLNLGMLPTPTCLVIPLYEMGRAAARMVLELIDTSNSQPEVIFNSVLREGGTCRKMK